MLVSELIEQLQSMPQDIQIAVNDNNRGVFHEEIESVDHFEPNDGDPECVVIQVNCD